MAWKKKKTPEEEPDKEEQPTREKLEKQLEELKTKTKGLKGEQESEEPIEGEPLEEASETEKISAPDKLEIVDMIQGHLSRASKLLEYYSSLA